MKEEGPTSVFDYKKITESVNGKLSIVEYSVPRKDNSLEYTMLKIVNLVGDWPLSPCIFNRKNYPKLIEFIMVNTKKLSTKQFLQSAIHHLISFQSEETLNELIVINRSQLPNQIYVSNSGNRVSFWLEEQTVNFLIGYEKISQLFKAFSWISEKQEKSFSNDIDYGSENFINLIEMLSLNSQMKLLSMVDYGGFEIKQIQESLHAATSLVNYNYRFFFPPKDATRFLKKTSGITLTCGIELKQRRSKKWAESIFLDSLFELRPTKVMARILGDPSGPIYLEKYIFSDYFYAQIQRIYFLSEIEDYFHPKNIRETGKYLTFVSRINSESLFTEQAKEEIQKLKGQGWLEEKLELLLGQQEQEESDLDSDEEEITSFKPQPATQLEKVIVGIYKGSQEAVFKKIKDELSCRMRQIKGDQIKLQSQINSFEQKANERVVQIDIVTNSGRAGNITYCMSCGFSKTRIGCSQNSIVEFISLFNYGNDSFCHTCEDLTIKERIVAKINREIQEKTQAFQQFQAMQIAQNQRIMAEQEKQLQKLNQKKAQIAALQTKKSEQTQNSQSLTTSEKTLPKSSNQLLAQTQEKTEEQKFEQSMTGMDNDSNIGQTTNEGPKRGQIDEKYVDARRKLWTKAEDQRKTNIEVNSNVERKLLLAQKSYLTWYLIVLRIKNQCNEFISSDYFHDSFQLSLISPQLTSKQYIHDELIDVLDYYFGRILSFILKTKTNLTMIPNILENMRTLSQVKYRIIQANVFSFVLGKSINVDSKDRKYLSVQNQRDELFSKLYLFIDQKQEIYSAAIADHYRTYKQQMNAQYKVTQFELKQMIANFQAQLKEKIAKTTQNFLFPIRWLILVLTEYVQAKTLKLITEKVGFQEDNGIAFFCSEVEFLLNLLATFIHVFNQPGQTKFVDQAELEISNCLLLIIQNQKFLKEKQKIEFDPDVIEVLLQDMLEHFVSKISSDAKQEAKKLTLRHQEKFKGNFVVKLKSLKVKKIFNFNDEFKSFQFKLADSSLLAHSKRNIFLSKNLHVEGQVTNEAGYFSSLMFINQYFEKQQREYFQNFEIFSFVTLLSSVTEKSVKRESLVMRSKSEGEYRIKIGVVYKLICETLEKSECRNELVSIYKSGNKLLLELISFMIGESFGITYDVTMNEEIAKKVKLYVERRRYQFLKNTPNTIEFYGETSEILEFLFKNRHSFFDFENSNSFEAQFHMIIQIIALNTLPLFNIEIAYKTELKEIGKALKHFDVNDGYNAIEDYYLVVLNFRHNKSKEKRKKEIEVKAN